MYASSARPSPIRSFIKRDTEHNPKFPKKRSIIRRKPSLIGIMNHPQSSDESMGDESAEKFPLLTFYKEGEAKTCVYWDLNDYPIPSGVNPACMCESIKDAIWKQGIDGDVSIHAYVDDSEREYSDAGFQLEVCGGGKHTRNSAMLADMAIWAVINPTPCNVIVLAKVTDDFLATHVRSYCIRFYRQGRAPAQSDSTFLTRIFDGPRRHQRKKRENLARGCLSTSCQDFMGVCSCRSETF